MHNGIWRGDWVSRVGLLSGRGIARAEFGIAGWIAKRGISLAKFGSAGWIAKRGRYFFNKVATTFGCARVCADVRDAGVVKGGSGY